MPTEPAKPAKRPLARETIELLSKWCGEVGGADVAIARLCISYDTLGRALMGAALNPATRAAIERAVHGTEPTAPANDSARAAG